MRTLAAVLAVLAVVACSPKVETTTSKTTRTTTVAIPENAAKKTVDAVIQPLPTFVNKSMIGAGLGPDGMVTTEVTSFKRGQTVYLSLWLNESPVGLHAGAKWFDSADKQVDAEERPMNGAKLATFALKTAKLKPGNYRAEGFWGGNRAANKDFVITK
jgi:hypothetical protein